MDTTKQIIARLNETKVEADASNGRWDGETTVSFKVTGEAQFILPKLLHALHCMGSMGCSRTISIEDFGDNGGPLNFGFDGDGADKLNDITINGEPYEPED